MRKDINVPRGFAPRLRCAVDFVSDANNAELLEDKIDAAQQAIGELERFVKDTKEYQKRFKSFIEKTRYQYAEGHPPMLVVTTTNLEKPWVGVDKILANIGISRDAVMVTEYSYIHDEKKGRSIECRMTLK